ncbi:hypothetical protein [Kistimonas asteriae]|uniref:hypothetical protein n=1 Tax=Kistimonas asteriae TaxID=517724 RepID=UPI001FEB8189|nr:hypothetical protein [Kistimonas asteriae]
MYFCKEQSDYSPHPEHGQINFEVNYVGSSYERDYTLRGNGEECQRVIKSYGKKVDYLWVTGLSIFMFNSGKIYPEIDYPDSTACYTVKYHPTPSRRTLEKRGIAGKTVGCPVTLAADPSRPQELPSGTNAPGWTGHIHLCREETGYMIKSVWKTDSSLFGDVDSDLYPYTICAGGKPNGYNVFSVDIQPHTSIAPIWTVYPALDFKAGEEACYIVVKKSDGITVDLIVADRNPTGGGCTPRK